MQMPIAVLCEEVNLILLHLGQVSPTPGPQTGTGPQPVRNWAAQQEVRGG